MAWIADVPQEDEIAGGGDLEKEVRLSLTSIVYLFFFHAVFITIEVQNQQTHSGMNQHFEIIHHMTFPKMFSDYALETYPTE